MILNLLLEIGFTAIDENLQKLIDAMRTFPEEALMAQTTSYAKALGYLIALGLGSYECYMMILGRRGMDVMKILHIIIISLCITFSSWIADAAIYPGTALGDQAKELALAKNQEVKEYEIQVKTAQEKYLAMVDTVLNKAQAEKTTEENIAKSDEGGLFGIDIAGAVETFKNNMERRLQKWAIAIETKICEWLSIIIRFIGEVLFQVAYYGMLVAQNIFLQIMKFVCPIMFAISLAPPFRSAWSQWLAKFISISLWGFVVYMILYYVNFIMLYNLGLDLQQYQNLMGDLSETNFDWENVGAIGMQGLGTTCMYVVGLLVGVFCLKFVPDVASWMIPGGVGSPVGGAAVGAATGAAGMAASGASSVVGAAVGAAPGAASAVGSGAKTFANDMVSWRNAQINKSIGKL